MQPTTKLYQNTSDVDLNVVGIGIIPAGEVTSITTAYQPAVIMENYPGLVDITDQQVAAEEAAPSSSTSSSVDTSPTNSQTNGGSES